MTRAILRDSIARFGDGSLWYGRMDVVGISGRLATPARGLQDARLLGRVWPIPPSEADEEMPEAAAEEAPEVEAAEVEGMDLGQIDDDAQEFLVVGMCVCVRARAPLKKRSERAPVTRLFIQPTTCSQQNCLAPNNS